MGENGYVVGELLVGSLEGEDRVVGFVHLHLNLRLPQEEIGRFQNFQAGLELVESFTEKVEFEVGNSEVDRPPLAVLLVLHHCLFRQFQSPLGVLLNL